MSKQRKSFIAYNDWRNAFDKMPDEAAGKLIKALFAFANGEDISDLEWSIAAPLEQYKSIILRDSEKWSNQVEQRSLAGKKSAEVRSTKSNDRSTTVEFRARKPTDSVSDSVSVSDNDSKSESNSDIGISAPATKKIDWKEKREQRKKEFYESLTPFIGTYTREMLRDFYEYWTEHGENDRLVKHEKKDSFSIPRRLATWHRNDFNKQPQDNLPRKKPKTLDDL